MRKITLEQPGSFVAGQEEAPSPRPDCAIARIHRIGVCGTDLHAFAGRQPFFEYPRILGHELGAEIVDIPPNDYGLKAGDRCAIEPYLSCGQCRACRIARPNCCETLQVLGVHIDGGMRGYLSIPLKYLHRSDRLSFDQLALIETLGIGAHAVARSGLQSQETALVIGAGPIGLSVIQFAMVTGASVRALDISEERRAFVGSWGVEAITEPDDHLADVVFDATGNAKSMEAAFERVAHGGRLDFVGLVQSRISFDDPLLHRREMTLLSSRNSANDFPGIIKMIENGEIDTTPWITHRLPLKEVPEQFPQLQGTPGLVKAMITVDPQDL